MLFYVLILFVMSITTVKVASAVNTLVLMIALTPLVVFFIFAKCDDIINGNKTGWMIINFIVSISL